MKHFLNFIVQWMDGAFNLIGFLEIVDVGVHHKLWFASLLFARIFFHFEVFIMEI